MAVLTERRKADRAKMAETLIAIAAEFGCETEVEGEGENSICPRRIQVIIKHPRGLQCAFDFDGQSCQHDVFVNGWHFSGECDTVLADCFPQGVVNSHHFRKCTTACGGFDSLCQHVRAVLTMANSGALFSEERERKRVAEYGTWQEQAARWEEYRQEFAARKTVSA